MKNIKTIKELIEFYLKVEGVSSKEETSLWDKANNISNENDEKGKKLLEIGREASKENQEVINEQEGRKIDLGPQVREASEEDKQFNRNITIFINKSIIEDLSLTQTHSQENDKTIQE